MATRDPIDGGRDPTADPALGPATGLPGPVPRTARSEGWRDGETDLRGLVGQLGRDASQLARDELTLARMELRHVAETFSAEMRDATRTMVKDLTRVGIALSLATMGGLALTAGAVLGIGRLLGGSFWAGGLIVGAVLLIVAAIFGASAGRDLKESESLRFERGRKALERNKDVLGGEARATGDMARSGAQGFKRHATGDAQPRPD